jgi:hypothetical protein
MLAMRVSKNQNLTRRAKHLHNGTIAKIIKPALGNPERAFHLRAGKLPMRFEFDQLPPPLFRQI